ncbi:MAG: T9SS type A sorting domain-containing protein [Taibaiella sp.]|nr:T9SS type A sorting domain-containing protein [Taibaiella sp.]
MKQILLILCSSVSLSITGIAQEACFQNNIINAGNTIDAYWPMNGDGNDLIGTANNPQGAIGAGVTFTGIPFSGSAAASFSGTGGIQYSDGTFMNTAITNVSFGAWIRPTTVPPGGNQMIFEEGGTNGISMYLNTTGEIVVVIASGGTDNDIRFAFPTDGLYHHVAFTYSSGRLVLFLDGLLQATLNATSITSIAAHTDAGGIGATFGSTSAAKTRFPAATFVSYQGLIDEAFYTRSKVADGNLLQYAQCLGRSTFAALGCTSDAFFVQGTSGNFNSLNLVTGTLSASATDGITSPNQNALGFNAIDGLFYGSDVVSGQIFVTQITPTPGGYTYSSKYVAYIAQLQAAGNIIVGDVYGGKMYLRNGNTNTHYVVDVNPSSPAYLQLIATVTESATNNFADWAYNPVDGALYAISSANGQLLKVDPNTGAVTNLGAAVPTAAYGAVFFDNQGYFYVYNNSTGVIYRINIASGVYTGVPFASSTSGLSNNDGARCADAPLPIDFGDLPDASTATVGAGTGTGQYNTLLSNNGPRHYVSPFVALTIGASVTVENDGKPNVTATGDVDDGISTFPSISGGSVHNIPSYSLEVSVNNQGTTAATLYGWIDWDNNGTFSAGERVSATVPSSFTGMVTLTWNNVTLGGVAGTTGVYALFRLSTDIAGQNPTGAAGDGEVESYFIPFVTPLPVNLLSFTLSSTNCTFTGKWETGKEESLDRFELEHSKDGVTFHILNTIYAKGSNSKYSYTNRHIEEGIHYYRLRIIDKDGGSAYSKVEKANIGCDQYAIIIYPNPATNLVTLSGLQSGQTISLINMWGQKFWTSKAKDATHIFSVADLTAGVYLITLTDEAGNILSRNELIKK